MNNEHWKITEAGYGWIDVSSSDGLNVLMGVDGRVQRSQVRFVINLNDEIKRLEALRDLAKQHFGDRWQG